MKGFTALFILPWVILVALGSVIMAGRWVLGIIAHVLDIIFAIVGSVVSFILTL